MSSLGFAILSMCEDRNGNLVIQNKSLHDIASKLRRNNYYGVYYYAVKLGVFVR